MDMSGVTREEAVLYLLSLQVLADREIDIYIDRYIDR